MRVYTHICLVRVYISIRARAGVLLLRMTVRIASVTTIGARSGLMTNSDVRAGVRVPPREQLLSCQRDFDAGAHKGARGSCRSNECRGLRLAPLLYTYVRACIYANREIARESHSTALSSSHSSQYSICCDWYD